MHTSTSRRQGRWARAVFAAAVAATLTLTASACTAGGAASETAKTSSDESLSLAVLGVPPSLDPAFLDDGQSSFIWQSLFDTLVYLDADGEIQPNAAESWEYSDDGLTLTLALRDGMTFSTGEPVSAAAVKATIERSMASAGAPASRLTAVDSVEAPDDLTLVLNLAHPDGALLSNLAFGAGVIGDPETIEDESTALRPVGSGAYTLDETKTTDGATYVLKRRADYWNVDAYPFETVTVKVIADNAAVFNALQSGEISAASLQADQVAAAEAAGLTMTEVPSTSRAVLLLMDRNGEVLPALADVRVRQAIAMAFDRESIAEGLLRGRGVAIGQVFDERASGYDEKLNDVQTYDTEKAKDLLAEAGYPNGFEVTLPSTFLSTQIEPLITQAFADIGITANWQPVPAQEVASSLASKKFPMAWFISGVSTQSRDLQSYAGATGLWNPFDPSDPELDRLYETANAAITDDDIADAYRAVNAYMVENAIMVPVFAVGQTWATEPGITYLGKGGAYTSSVRLFGLQD